MAIGLRAQGTPPRLMTRWASEVSREHPLPEYPRPQMARKVWTNLNGEWEYAIGTRGGRRPPTAGKIVVPFAIESALSGVTKPVSPEEWLWYRRMLDAPRPSRGERVLLHFGAVDWEAAVSVNGRAIGEHRGGYDPFTFDITDALGTSASQELVVRVWDPTDKGPQPRGKQVLNPRSIWYTAVTGIWQTVWLETVPATYVSSLRIDPDVDGGALVVRVNAAGADAATSTATVTVLDGTRAAAKGSGPAGSTIRVALPNAKLWSPSAPFLYTLQISLSSGDAVTSYAGMRKIAIAKAPDGFNRLFLNNQPLFQYGPLDQGWWPDGLYTAPTDEALRFDIEAQKKLGFNAIRKHGKVEPAR
jgi:beta-galactosidase/beta-glucuronidase